MGSNKPNNEEDYLGHNVTENRFGDTNLAAPFIWKKKWKSKHPDIKGKKLREMATRSFERRKRHIRTEVKNVKLLRENRIREKEALEQMREDIRIQLERENYGILNEKEERFHKEQIRERALIRIKTGRENEFDAIFKIAFFAQVPINRIAEILEIDHLVSILKKKRHFESTKRKLESIFDLKNPFSVIFSLDSAQYHKTSFETLKREIEKMLQLEENFSFWNTASKLVDFCATKKASVVKKQISNILEGKSVEKLEEIEREVNETVQNAKENKVVIDFEFWDELLSFVGLFKAKTILSDYYSKSVKTKLMLQSKYKEHLDFIKSKNNKNLERKLHQLKKNNSEIKRTENKFNLFKVDNITELKRIQRNAISQTEFNEQLRQQRDSVIKNKKDFLKIDCSKHRKNPIETVKSQEQKLYEKEARKPLEEGEEEMEGGCDSADRHFWWQDKFRPRKPLYFNRMKTGYDWNNYNRSHYDSENPPPKTVQGYKFNVFYPDLIDIKNAPTYVVEEIANDDDHVALKFKAGAPYEDIAFKIVNKEWDHDLRSGFRSTFSNGVLQLFFNFRRYSYRR